MSGPQRLREEGTEAERGLLRAADQDRLSPAAKQRIVAAIGLGTAIGTTASGALGATAKAGAKLPWLAASKWIFVAAGAVVLVGGAARYLSHRAPSAITAAPVSSSEAVAAPAPEATESGAIAPTAAPVASEAIPEPPRRPLPPQAPASSAKAPSLAEEVAALEAVRAALGRHDPGGALAALALYEQAFPRRSLGLEASMMRIEALLQQGNRPAAIAAAKRVLRTDRTYEARIRSLVPELTTP